MIRLINPKADINLHTHSIYCDGKDEPELMVLKAVELGFNILGFSGHGYAECDLDCCMSRENEKIYREVISDLKAKYKNKIDIRLGIERDYFGEDDGFEYDFVIGSCHYIEAGGEIFSVDDTAEIMKDGVERLFGGDYKAYAKCYYDTVVKMTQKIKPDIIAHYDLLTKFNKANLYFDQESDWYKEIALKGIKDIMKIKIPKRKGISDILGKSDEPVFEINTGAMSRGYQDRPYPEKYQVEEVNRLGGSLIISSDCHNRENLDYAFKEILNIYK